jgi:hypothetical protein
LFENEQASVVVLHISPGFWQLPPPPQRPNELLAPPLTMPVHVSGFPGQLPPSTGYGRPWQQSAVV